MKKLKISLSSTAAFLIIVLVLISTAKIVVFDQITSDSTGGVSKSEDLVGSNKIGTESSSSKNDGVQDASVVVDIDLLKEKNHNNKEEVNVHDDKENEPIPNSTDIIADHIEAGTEMSANQGATIEVQGKEEEGYVIDENAAANNIDELERKTTKQILVWNKDSMQSIVRNTRVTSQRVKLEKSDMADPNFDQEYIGEIHAGGQLVVNLTGKDHLFWKNGQIRLCNLLRKMAIIDTIPPSKGVTMPKRPLLIVTYDCDGMTNRSGNWIVAIYLARIAAAAAQVDIQLQCQEDKRVSQLNSPILWFETYQAAPSAENAWPFKGKQLTEQEICTAGYAESRVDIIIDEIKDDFQKLGVTVFGSQNNRRHSSVALNQPALLPETEIDEVAIHLRCGDMINMQEDSNRYGLMKFSGYKKWISRDTRSVGIVTQSFDTEHLRHRDRANADSCRAIVYHLAEYIQGFLPLAEISIRNSSNETIVTAFARLVMTKQSFTARSSFGILPVISAFGESYIQDGQNGVNAFAEYLPNYDENLTIMDTPILTTRDMRNMDLQSILDWLVKEEDDEEEK